MSALLFVPLVPFPGLSLKCSEISLTPFVTAIAIKFDCIAGAFARSAAVLSALLRRARARWILAFFFVSHLLLSYDFLLEKLPDLGATRSLTQSCRRLVSRICRSRYPN